MDISGLGVCWGVSLRSDATDWRRWLEIWVLSMWDVLASELLTMPISEALHLMRQLMRPTTAALQYSSVWSQEHGAENRM